MSITKAANPKQHSHILYNTPVFFRNHVRKKKLNSRQKDASFSSHIVVFYLNSNYNHSVKKKIGQQNKDSRQNYES